MLVLDTDHLSELGYGSPAGLRLRARLLAKGESPAITIISIEEQLRGWLAEIHRLASPHRQIPAYQRLHERIRFFAGWATLPFESTAADLFMSFRSQGIRIGSMDLKIACIVLQHQATLLTRNSNDFEKVPRLKFANWLED